MDWTLNFLKAVLIGMPKRKEIVLFAEHQKGDKQVEHYLDKLKKYFFLCCSLRPAHHTFNTAAEQPRPRACVSESASGLRETGRLSDCLSSPCPAGQFQGSLVLAGQASATQNARMRIFLGFSWAENEDRISPQGCGARCLAAGHP